MWEFNRIYRNLEGALTDAAQFADLLLDPPSVQDVASPVPFAPRDHGVEVRDISFRHSPAQPLLFDRFSLTVAAGTKLGLVGRSGGGKTTITRLLLRFKDVERGQILVGGQSIADVAQSSLREAIAYVPQDPAMFHRTIADNIRFGRPRATDEEVRRAAELAHAAEFIESLPDGYDTLVGERGIKLSGGQRQRIAIARAILKDAPILDPRRGHELARLRERSAHSGRALDADGGTHGDRHRAPSVDGPPHGLARRPRPAADRRAGNARAPARARRHLCRRSGRTSRAGSCRRPTSRASRCEAGPCTLC